jgi:hypothetical protein
MGLACKAKPLIFQVRGSGIGGFTTTFGPLTLSLSPRERGPWGDHPLSSLPLCSRVMDIRQFIKCKNARVQKNRIATELIYASNE